MAHKAQQEFCERVKEKYPDYFRNKKVLDIGSLDINGSNRGLFENCSYIGLDIGEGRNVDVVSIGHLYDAPNEYFDTIISTNAFEHDMFYEQTFANIFRMLKPGGMFLMTCGAPGWPEHGTRRTGTDSAAPLLINISEEWADYYKNLSEEDVKKIPQFIDNFPDGYFEYGRCDEGDFHGIGLHFYGIKGGIKYLTNEIVPIYPKESFDGEIFVVDCWIDTESKEADLVNLIKRLKIYNIPILLTGHYPVKPEIQKMVDYFLYDKNNPLLYKHEFASYGVNSARWTQIGNIRVENHHDFQHDYAIWETMRNAFNFCKYLGKWGIHFVEYDNLPDPFQYRQAFMDNLKYNDAVIYEYDENSSFLPDPYVSTFIFSVRTDVAIKAIDLIKTKEEFFKNKPNRWQLESNFFNSLRSATNSIYRSKYIPNNNELNMQAVWNKEGINRDGTYIQMYLAVDISNELYLHTISDSNERQIEIRYINYNKFHFVNRDGYLINHLGQYRKGHTVRVYYEGREIFSEFLGLDVEKYRDSHKLIKPDEMKTPVIQSSPREININFIDGPFLEIRESKINEYRVQFINKDNDFIEYQVDMKSNHWAKCSKRYGINWILKIWGITEQFYYEHEYNPRNKRVLISFESKSLGDTLAWIAYVEKYRIEKKCTVICSTFHNSLFKVQYPNIEFVEPGTNVNNIYALFRVGVFYKGTEVDLEKHKTDPKTEPLTKICSDILGLDYVELKPYLPIFASKKKKQVSIAIHATAQCKYWNNPDGWQDVVDFLNKNGYEVKLLSHEEDGYMGNKNPEGVIKVPPGKLENIIKIIQESELFIGISSGLSWISWAARTETILISGFTDVYLEPMDGIRRIINKDVCNSCWHKFHFDPGDWNWCPVHKGTDRQFECSKSITSEQVIEEIKSTLKIE